MFLIHQGIKPEEAAARPLVVMFLSPGPGGDTWRVHRRLTTTMQGEARKKGEIYGLKTHKEKSDEAIKGGA